MVVSNGSRTDLPRRAHDQGDAPLRGKHAEYGRYSREALKLPSVGSFPAVLFIVTSLCSQPLLEEASRTGKYTVRSHGTISPEHVGLLVALT